MNRPRAIGMAPLEGECAPSEWRLWRVSVRHRNGVFEEWRVAIGMASLESDGGHMQNLREYDKDSVEKKRRLWMIL